MTTTTTDLSLDRQQSGALSEARGQPAGGEDRDRLLPGQYRQGDDDQPVRRQLPAVVLRVAGLRARRPDQQQGARSRRCCSRGDQLEGARQHAAERQLEGLRQAFNFSADGAAAPTSSTSVATTTSDYVEQQLEGDQGASDPGVQTRALFRARRADDDQQLQHSRRPRTCCRSSRRSSAFPPARAPRQID